MMKVLRKALALVCAAMFALELKEDAALGACGLQGRWLVERRTRTRQRVLYLWVRVDMRLMQQKGVDILCPKQS